MKTKKIAALACTAAFALCLAGCSSDDASKNAETAESEQGAAAIEQESSEAVTLDQEVSVGQMTAMVSAEWTEEAFDYPKILLYTIDDDVFFGVSLSESESAFGGIDKEISNYYSSAENMDWENFEAAAYGERIVDDLPCYFMTASKDYDNNGETVRTTTYHAYIVAEDDLYWNVSANDWDLLNQILDTVTIA